MLIFRDLLFFSLCVEVFTFKLPNHDDYRTSEALIFGRCKKNYGTIIMNDDSRQLSLTWLQQLHQQFHSITLHKQLHNINSHRKKSIYQHKFPMVKKVDAMLITILYARRLQDILDNLYKTMWWNVMIPVYILHLPDNDCIIAMETLQQMWKNNTLTTHFLCIENNEVQIYTYNPTTSRIPSDWTEVQTSPLEPQWTLYRQTFKTETACQRLDFDRTKYLDGHQITVLAPEDDAKYGLVKSNYIFYNDITRHDLIIDALNLTLKLKTRLYNSRKISLTKSRTRVKMGTGNISEKVSPNLILVDYYMQSGTVLNNKAYTLTYPLAWYVNGVATLNRGHRTLGEKVWNFYGIWTVLFTIFVLLVTFAVIWFSERRKTSFAVFEIIRLLISQSLYTRMNTLSLRIFFITILIYFLIIQATFNGHLAKFLTKPELRKQVETQEDLNLLGYKSIYSSTNVKKYSVGHLGHRYKIYRNTGECVNNFLHNDTSACVFDLSMLLEHARRKENLYVSKKPLGVEYTGYPTTKHWPLLNRISWLFILLEDLGFRQWLSKRDLKRYSKQLQNMIKTTSNDDFQPIKLENLIFSFWILAVGLTSATVSFCVEMFICYKSKLNLISHMKNIKKGTITKRGVLVRPERSTRLTSQ